MTEIHAKPIVEGKFWIVEKDGSKIATLHKKENNKLYFQVQTVKLCSIKKTSLLSNLVKIFS